MKKYIGSIILSIAVGIYLGKFMFNQYDNITLLNVSNTTSTLYFIEAGIYKTEEEMKNNMNNFSYYIYNEENNEIHAYIGITKNKKNAEIIKEYWKNKSYDINIREINISNKNLISVIEEYDKLLETIDETGIEDICGQTLISYEELVINEN